MTKFYALKFSFVTLLLLVTSFGAQVFAQVPAISSFTPSSGAVGTLVTITGTDLGTPTAFTIGGASAIVVSNTGTVLVGMVMPGAVTGAVSVTTAGGTGTAGSNFTVTATQVPNTQQGNKLVGTGNIGAANQGSSISVSADGNTAIVGGSNDNTGVGAAWIYTRTAGVWNMQGNKLVGTGNIGAGRQGSSVALSADGNTAIVGGHFDNGYEGAVWIYTRTAGVWSQQGNKLVGTGNSGTASLGISVSLSADGNTAIVGGYGDDGGQGAAWVFTRTAGVWSQQGNKLVGTGVVNVGAQGMSVAISADGNTAVVGGYRDDNFVGAIWVYTRAAGVWSQQGGKLVGTGVVIESQQGRSVALSADGNTALVGGYADNSSQGAVWIFTRTAGVWSQQGNKLVGTGQIGSASLGISVSLSADGNTAIVGGLQDNSSKGAVWTYTRTAGVWSQQGDKLAGTGSSGPAGQGISVSMSADGGTAIVGGHADNSYQGAAWVYTHVPPPTISSFTPSSGPVGTLVTITGTNLTTPTAFTIGGAPAIVISNTGTSLVGMVMPGAVTGAVSLSARGGIATGGSNFTVTAAQVPNAQQGNKLVGTGNIGTAQQGYKVSLSADGNTAVVGGWYDNSEVGAVWMYTRTGGLWSQQGNKLVGSGYAGASKQGFSLSLSADGNTALVGGQTDNSNIGAAWVYTRTGGVWSQQGSKLVGTGGVGAALQGSSVSLSADGNTAMVGGTGDNSNKGAVWVYTRTEGVWSQQGNKLVGTGNSGNGSQGISVSLSADGNTAIVGAQADNSFRGAAWVYSRTAGVWSQQGNKLVGTGNTGNASQGISVSLSADGNTALVGGNGDDSNRGAAWVYTRTGGIWSQQGNKLVGAGAVGSAGGGISVSLSADGNTAIVGGHTDNSNQGAAWMYTRTGGVWSQQGNKLVGTGNTGTARQAFSVSLSADGNTAVVGGYFDNSSQGAAWVYTYVPPPAITSFTPSSGSVGTLVTITGTNLGTPTAFNIGGASAIVISNTGTTLVGMVMPGAVTGAVSITTAGGTGTAGSNFTITAAQVPNAQQGNKLVGTGNTGAARQGGSISISADGNTAIVGGSYDNNDVGAVWVYTRTGGVWNQQGNKLVGTGNVGAARQGFSVALSADGNTAIVGGPRDNGGQGAAWIFTRTAGVWSQQGNKLVGTLNVGNAEQGFAVSLSADGNTAAVGGYADNTLNGAVWVFNRSSGFWNQQGNKLVGTGGVGFPSHGYSVSLSADGNTVIAGGYNDNNGQGAAWVYTRAAGVWSQEGNKLLGTGRIGNARQGESVALSADGHTAMVGGSGDDSENGAVWVYMRTAGIWSQQGNKLVGTGSIGAANQGRSVALSADGSTAMVGGLIDNGYQGAAWFYSRTVGVWSQRGTKRVGAGNTGTAYQGSAVSLSADGSTALVGGLFDNAMQGAAWVYTYVPPPTVSNATASAVTTNSATLHGNVNDNGTATTVSFDYGTASDLTGATNTAATTGGSVTAGAGSTAVALALNGLTPGTTYYFRAKGVNAGGTTNGSPILSFTMAKVDQTISFAALPAKTFGDAAFNLSATGGASGETVNYLSSNPAVATITGNTVTIIGAGTTNITAVQAGNANYNAAAAVMQALTVTEADQTISFAALPAKTFGDAVFNLSATGGASGETVNYLSSNPAVATITGNTVTIIGAGTTNITAVQAGNANYNAAAAVMQALTVNKADQTINFAALPTKTFGDAVFNLSATGGASGNAITYLSSNPAVATITGSTVTIVGAGTTNITAIQAGNANFNAAGAVVQSLVIGKAALTVTASAQTKTYNGAAHSGGNGVTYSGFATGDNAANSLSGSLVYGGTSQGAISAGTYTLVPSGLSSAKYSITYTNGTLTVDKAALTITADNKSKVQGTANPALTASYSGFAGSDNSSVLSTQATLVTTATTVSAAGTYPITASGAAAANYTISYVSGTLTVTGSTIVTPVNSAPTNISLSRSDIDENNLIGAMLGTFSTSDPDAGDTFTYALTAGSGSTDNGSFNISGNQLFAASRFDFETKASYSIRIRTTDNGGQSFEKVFIISINDVMEVNPVTPNQAPTLAAIANQTICYTTTAQSISLSGITPGPESGQTTTLTVSATGTALGGLSIIPGSGGTATLRYTPINATGGTTTVTVTVKDDGGTANGGNDTFVRTFTITVNSLPVAAIGSDKALEISKGDIATLTASGGISYRWANAEGVISGQNTAILTVKPLVNTTYRVTATNATGCSSTSEISFIVLEDFQTIQAHNVVSPNGDGVNDFWQVNNIELYPNNEVRVFDRSGRPVFTKKGYTNTWDATINGSPLAEDTYYYIVDFGNGGKKIKGFITIVRQ